MGCKNIREQIRIKVRKNGSVVDDPELMHHLKKCEPCRSFCTDALLERSLREMPVPESRAGFAAEAIQHAVNTHRAKIRRAFYVGVSAAAAVMMIIGAAIFLPNQGAVFFGAPQTAVIIPADGGATVRIMIEAAAPRQNATFTIDLSENVALKNHPGQNRLRWQTDLLRGRNLLELPLVLRSGAGGYVNVRYKYNGFEKKARIQVQPATHSGLKTPVTI